MEEKIVKVSVIIPVYNTEMYLYQNIKSVLNQSLREIEVIAVDDGSTDGSFALLKEIEKKDSRLKVYQQKNLYAGAARNFGMSVAKGEFLVFLDSDDFLKKICWNSCISSVRKTMHRFVYAMAEFMMKTRKNTGR